MSNTSQSRIPRWVMDWSLIVGIVVLLVTFVNYGMSFLYPAPEYQDFCGHERYATVAPEEIITAQGCRSEGGKWTAYETPRDISETRADALGTTTVSGTCDQDYYCRQDYQAARDIHDRNGLLALLIIGLAVATAGFMRKESDIISSSFSIGGVIVILSGLMRFWPSTEDWAQFILLGALLVAFVYLAVKRT